MNTKRRRIDPHGQRAAIDKFKNSDKLAAGSSLRAILDSEAIEKSIAAYEEENARAIKFQNRYKQLGWWALLLATLGTLLAAATLLPISKWVSKDAARIISGLQAGANIISLLIVSWLHRSGVADAWMTTRAEAERRRGEIFDQILKAEGVVGANAGRLWADKFALFEAAHIDYQRAYFESAKKRHTRAARSMTVPRRLALLTTLGAVVIGAFTLAGLWPERIPEFLAWLFLSEEPIRWQLGLNTIASSLLAYASAYTLMNQDERNAALYDLSARRLDDLKDKQLAGVKAAAAAGDGARVQAFAREAQSILEGDHQVWLLTRPAYPPPTARL